MTGTANGVPSAPVFYGREAVTVAPPIESPRATADAVEAAVQRDVIDTDYPVLDAAYHSAEVRKAGEAIAAATPPALEPATSPTDRLSLDAVPALAERVAVVQKRADAADMSYNWAADDQAKLPRPWSTPKRAATVVLLTALSVITCVGVAALLTGGVQFVFIRPLLAPVLGSGARPLMYLASGFVSLALAAAVILPQLAATLIAWGRLGRRKWLFLVVDLLFTAGFTILRGGHGMLASIAVGAFEVALLLGASITLAIADSRFKLDFERADSFRVAKTKVQAVAEAREDAQKALAVARSELAAQIAAIANREALVRTLEARRKLAETTASVAVMTTTASLISKATVNPSEDEATEILREDLVATYADLKNTIDERAFP